MAHHSLLRKHRLKAVTALFADGLAGSIPAGTFPMGTPDSIIPLFARAHSRRRDGGRPNVVAILLLIVSNIFMTVAWYGHLRFMPESRFPLIAVIALSWGIAFFEYCFQVPANRIGYRMFSATQLKIFQEIISISVFIVFAILVLHERPRWNHGLAFLLIGAAAVLAVRK